MLNWLAAPEDVDLKAWDAYLRGVNAKLTSSWGNALSAFRTLRDIRQRFNLPLVAQAGESPERSAGALSPGQFQSMLELAAMVDTMKRALDDAVGSRRKLGYDQATGDMQIERLPSDATRIEVRGDRPTIISNQTNAPVEVTGTIDGTVGIAPIAWVGIGVAGTIVTIGTIYLAVQACDTLRQVSEDKARITIANQQHERVMSGKATPEQSAAMTRSLYDAEAELERAKSETQKTAGLSPDTAKTIRVVAYVGLGVAAIYLASKLVPQRAAATA